MEKGEKGVLVPLRGRAAAPIEMNPTALAAILTGSGVVLLGGIVVLAIALWLARRTHNRLLADLEERGVAIAQSQVQGSKRNFITKPKTVLKRNQVLPFNGDTGWGTLPSVESVNLVEPASVPPHYAPPKPAGFVSKTSRLSWPFLGRRASGKAMRLRKLRVSVLSTVVESPRPSPLVPVLTAPPGGEPISPTKHGSRPSSDQSLLQHHPAFRISPPVDVSESIQSMPTESLKRSLTTKPVTDSDLRPRPNRSKSVADIPICLEDNIVSRLTRPSVHTRAASACRRSSGHVPDVPIPPQPLEVARLRAQERQRIHLNRSPSRVSVSSFESGNSSILTTQSSPLLQRPGNVRVQKISKRDWRSPRVDGPRPLRDTLSLHGRPARPESPLKNSAIRLNSEPASAAIPAVNEERISTLIRSSSTQSMKLKMSDSVNMSRVSSPMRSPMTTRSYTPKRRSGSYVTAYGSPEERQKASTGIVYNNSVPKRQLSQASTHASSSRSSYGNPFQWDTTPLSSGKPSALKGSPSARKGHRRQSKVRLSLQPIILGPPSRSPSLSRIHDIQEESPNTSIERACGAMTGFSSPLSLPKLPSTSIFAPDVKINATSIRGSLTPSSSTLSMANFDYGHTYPYNTHALAGAQFQDSLGMSIGSSCATPQYSFPRHGTVSVESFASAPPTFALPRPPSASRDGYWSSGPPSSPFDESIMLDSRSSPARPLLADEYERRGLVYQTPRTSPTQSFFSPFSTIPEEPSTLKPPALYRAQPSDQDSPPCSPKTLRPNMSMREGEITLDTIDPALLKIDNFSTLNKAFDPLAAATPASGMMGTEVSIPSTPKLVERSLEPLLDAGFPSSPLVTSDASTQSCLNKGQDPIIPSAQSSPSSLYSYASPSSFPSPPCSIRPAHAQLPAPTLNFTSIPTLAPFPAGPRGSPPRPLRSSIMKLRRMNSDAEESGKEKAGRGERRYLKLGREDSIALPGEDSFLDEMDALEGDNNDDKKDRHHVSDLQDWEEEATILDLEDEEIKEQELERSEPALPSNVINNRDAAWMSTQRPPLPTPREKAVRPHHRRRSLSQNPTTPSSSPRPDRDPHMNASIWEDGEKFWTIPSPLPQASSLNAPHNSGNEPENSFVSLSSSPVPKQKSKRKFEVAKDKDGNEMISQCENNMTSNVMDANGNGERRESLSGTALASVNRPTSNRYRKRSALGIGTPNVNIRIQVEPPSGGSVGNGEQRGNETPGSLYDGDGFLRG